MKKKHDEKDEEKNVLRARKMYETATMAYRQHCCSHQQHTSNSNTAATHNSNENESMQERKRTNRTEQQRKRREIWRDREKRSNNSYGGDSGSWCDMCHVCTSIWCSLLLSAQRSIHFWSRLPAIRTNSIMW